MAEFVVSEDLRALGQILDSSGNPVTGAPSVEVSKNSAAAVGERRTLNLIEGANITLTIADDAGGNEIDVTIAASGGATVAQIWDEATSAHVIVGSTGRALDDLGSGYKVVVTRLNDALNATGVTNVVNVSEVGILLAIAIRVTVAITGTPSSELQITADSPQTTFITYSGATTWDNDTKVWSPEGDGGNAVGNIAHFPIGSRYKTSIKVGHNVTTAGSGGAIDIAVIRGVKL